MSYKRTPYLSENHSDPDPEGLLQKRDHVIPKYSYSAIYDEPSFDYVMVKTSENAIR